MGSSPRSSASDQADDAGSTTRPGQHEGQSGGFTMAGARLPGHDADLPADITERQCCGESFDPLLLDELLDEEGLDGSPWIAAAGLDEGGDIRLHLIDGVFCSFLLG